MERRGVAFETDAYMVDEQLIWGATARIISTTLLLDRRADATRRSRSSRGVDSKFAPTPLLPARPRGSPTPSTSRRSS